MKLMAVDFSGSKKSSIRSLGTLPQIFDKHGVPVKNVNRYIVDNCRSWSINTIKTYSDQLLNFYKWLEKSRSLSKELTRQLLAEYAHYLAAVKKNKPRSSNLALTVALGYCRWCDSEENSDLFKGEKKIPVRKYLMSANSRLGILDEPIIEPIKFCLLEYVHEFENKLKTKAISGKYGVRNNLIARLMSESGMRVSEVVGLEVDNLGAIDEKNGYAMASIIGKGRKRRFVPIPGGLARDLFGYIELEREKILEIKKISKVTKVLFLSHFGRALTTGYIQGIFRSLSKKIKRKITPHSLRHTFATYDYLKNRDIVRLQKILGHSSVKVTSIYIGEAALLGQSEDFQKYVSYLESGFEVP